MFFTGSNSKTGSIQGESNGDKEKKGFWPDKRAKRKVYGNAVILKTVFIGVCM